MQTVHLHHGLGGRRVSAAARAGRLRRARRRARRDGAHRSDAGRRRQSHRFRRGAGARAIRPRCAGGDDSCRHVRRRDRRGHRVQVVRQGLRGAVLAGRADRHPAGTDRRPSVPTRRAGLVPPVRRRLHSACRPRPTSTPSFGPRCPEAAVAALRTRQMRGGDAGDPTRLDAAIVALCPLLDCDLEAPCPHCRAGRHVRFSMPRYLERALGIGTAAAAPRGALLGARLWLVARRDHAAAAIGAARLRRPGERRERRRNPVQAVGMSAYLQRLVDGAANLPPLAVPVPRSASPIFAHDQRLGDPGLDLAGGLDDAPITADPLPPLPEARSAPAARSVSPAMTAPPPRPSGHDRAYAGVSCPSMTPRYRLCSLPRPSRRCRPLAPVRPAIPHAAVCCAFLGDGCRRAGRSPDTVVTSRPGAPAAPRPAAGGARDTRSRRRSCSARAGRCGTAPPVAELRQVPRSRRSPPLPAQPRRSLMADVTRRSSGGAAAGRRSDAARSRAAPAVAAPARGRAPRGSAAAAHRDGAGDGPHRREGDRRAARAAARDRQRRARRSPPRARR